jgi:hypothetical protein
MNTFFEFDRDEVAALVRRSLRAKGFIATNGQAGYKELRKDKKEPPVGYRPHWTEVDETKLEPGLILVVGRGVYLSSNDVDQDWENGKHYKSYADGLDAEKLKYDDWNDCLNEMGLGDEEREQFIPVEAFYKALAMSTGSDQIVVDWDDESDEVLFCERPNAKVSTRQQ